MNANNTKLDRLREHMANGRVVAALRIAASFPRLGEHKTAIEQGDAALHYPEFYREIGKDPAALVQAGLAAIRERYNIKEPGK